MNRMTSNIQMAKSKNIVSNATIERFKLEEKIANRKQALDKIAKDYREGRQSKEGFMTDYHFLNKDIERFEKELNELPNKGYEDMEV